MGDALDDMIKAVEAGTAKDFRALLTDSDNPAERAKRCGWASSAYNGSLDAALRLHESLLPGWDVTGLDQASNLAGSPWGCSIGYFDGTNPNNNRKAYSGHNFDRNPARAWLLAILRALQAQPTPLDEPGPVDPRRRG